MSNTRATEAVNPKKRTTAALERNGEDDFDSILKPIITKFGEDHITLQ
jgi:hypothetical protein